jgi:hypothetical protein
VGACGTPLIGSDARALVAVSTRYLSSEQGGWQPEPGACGKCMVRGRGGRGRRPLQCEEGAAAGADKQGRARRAVPSAEEPRAPRRALTACPAPRRAAPPVRAHPRLRRGLQPLAQPGTGPCQRGAGICSRGGGQVRMQGAEARDLGARPGGPYTRSTSGWAACGPLARPVLAAGRPRDLPPVLAARAPKTAPYPPHSIMNDGCGECEDDHIDVLLDRPLGYAPYAAARADPDGAVTNRHAPLVNRLPGLRGFNDAAMLWGGPSSPEMVRAGAAGRRRAPGRRRAGSARPTPSCLGPAAPAPSPDTHLQTAPPSLPPGGRLHRRLELGALHLHARRLWRDV